MTRAFTGFSRAADDAALPGGPHAFDLFHSRRFEAVVDAIEAFAAWVIARDGLEFERPTRHN